MKNFKMHFRGLMTAALVTAAGLATPGMAAPGLVNGSFESGPAYNQGNGSARGVLPTGWSAIPGLEVPDILGPAYNQGGAGFAQLLHAQDGDRWLDMNGSSPTGGLFQDVTGLLAGSNASIDFFVSSWAQNSSGTLLAKLIDASNGTVLSLLTINIPYNPGAQSSSWVQYSLSGTVAASGALRVQFEGDSGSNARGAPGLDNVVLTAVEANGAVPEPASWAMMIAGFTLAGAAMRRRTLQFVHAS
jgi:hypothetical protein